MDDKTIEEFKEFSEELSKFLEKYKETTNPLITASAVNIAAIMLATLNGKGDIAVNTALNLALNSTNIEDEREEPNNL